MASKFDDLMEIIMSAFKDRLDPNKMAERKLRLGDEENYNRTVAHQDAMEKQGLVNTGHLDVQKENSAGLLARQGLMNEGERYKSDTDLTGKKYVADVGLTGHQHEADQRLRGELAKAMEERYKTNMGFEGERYKADQGLEGEKFKARGAILAQAPDTEAEKRLGLLVPPPVGSGRAYDKVGETAKPAASAAKDSTVSTRGPRATLTTDRSMIFPVETSPMAVEKKKKPYDIMENPFPGSKRRSWWDLR